MSEHLNLNLGDGRQFEMQPSNATLYTFAGKLAMFNHVFLVTHESDDEETIQGTYVFHMAEAYPALANFMVEQAYPMILNRLDVPDCDRNAYNRYIDQQIESEQIPDEVPDWLQDGNE